MLGRISFSGSWKEFTALSPVKQRRECLLSGHSVKDSGIGLMGPEVLTSVLCLAMTSLLGQEKVCSDNPGLGHRPQSILLAATGIS